MSNYVELDSLLGALALGADILVQGDRPQTDRGADHMRPVLRGKSQSVFRNNPVTHVNLHRRIIQPFL